MIETGHKVVCIDDSNLKERHSLIKDKIYTVIGFNAIGGYLLKETYNGEKYGAPYWWGHRAERFRKCDENFADTIEKMVKESIKELEIVLA